MAKPRVAIIILNWNGRTFLQKFLPSVYLNSGPDAKIIVADNGSTDDSITFLQHSHPEIEIIKLGNNHGYAGGYNLALRQVEAEYYVLLNSDVEVTPYWIEPIVEYLDEHADVAAAQPKIMSWNNRKYFEYAGAAGGFIDILAYPFCRGRIFNVLEKDNGQYNDVAEIFWATGASLFLRAESFWQAGGFDEKFFAHFEEIDLCWRLKNLDFKIIVFPQSVVYHVGGATLPKNNPLKTFLNFRNSLWCLAKNMPARIFYPLLPVRLSLDVAAAFVFLLKGQARDFLAVFKAHLAFFSNLIKLRRQNSNRPKKLPSGVLRGSIVLNRFLGGVKIFSKLNVKKLGL